MMYEKIKEEILKDAKKVELETKFFIENGYTEKWGEKIFSDLGIERYSTKTRLEQYKKGIISRCQAVDYAVKRFNKRFTKEIKERLETLEKIENAENIDCFSIHITWKNSIYGKNPHVTLYAGDKKTYGYASGCGYDKESEAVAQAFNGIYELLKITCDLKEKSLLNGVSSESNTAVTGRDNRDVVGYGAGYKNIPYLHGGCGMSSFISIFEKSSYKYSYAYEKGKTYYTFFKEA